MPELPMLATCLVGWRDVRAACARHHLVTTFGRHDVASLYKRSRVGAFWLTISMAITIGAIGLVFGPLFGVPLHDFLPYFAAGSIVWGFASSCLNGGCSAFIAASGVILQVRMPLSVHVLRLMYRDVIILAHNIAILPVVFIVCAQPVSWRAVLFLPGMALLVINLGWMMLVLAILCARFRDVSQMVHNAVQVLFFVTPVMWNPAAMPSRRAGLALAYNPFFHLISIARDPLLGRLPTLTNWSVGAALALVGWVVALALFGRYRNRITYWL